MSDLPAVIYVGPAEYELRIKKKHPLLGETNSTNGWIKIRSTQSASSARDTLLHELLHAIFWESGFRANNGLSDDVEEGYVRTLAPWILQALRDNPDLVTFLLEDCRG